MCLFLRFDLEPHCDALRTYENRTFYKIFSKEEDKLYGQYYGRDPKIKRCNQEYHLGILYTAEPLELPDTYGREYNCGFHAYIRKPTWELSRDEAIYLVELTNICAIGVQNGYQAVVGRTMKILEEVK